MEFRTGRVAVVTGGGSGIGAAICRLLGRAGLRVAVADIDMEAAKQVAGAIVHAQGQAIACHVDIASDDSLATLATQVEELWGGCHLLFANAGVMVLGRLETLTRQDWDWLLAVNVLGTIRTVQHFLPQLRHNGPGSHVVITSSMAGLLAAGPYKGGYNVTKHALMAYGETLREELREEGVHVSMLLPAGVQSRITESGRNRHADFGSSRPLDPADIQGIVAGIGDDTPVDADYAVRNLLDDLEANRPWIITHTSGQKTLIEQRFSAILQAFGPADADRDPA